MLQTDDIVIATVGDDEVKVYNHCRQAFHGNSSSSHKSSSLSSSNSGSTDADEVWLECDDDSISVVTRKQFEDELSSKQSSTTPYLLFYQRI
jgi:hypothetical protein